MGKRTLLFLILLNTQFLFSTVNIIDSLELLLDVNRANCNDSSKYLIYRELIEQSKDPLKILKYCKGIYICGIDNNNIKWQADAKYYESFALKSIGEQDVAVSALYHSIELYKECGSIEGLAAATVQLADIFSREENYSISEDKYWESVNIYKQLKDTINLSSSYLNLGEMYRYNKKLGDALSCFQKSECLFSVIKYPYGIAYAKGNIGLVYVAQNKLDSAEVYLNKSISILEPLGDNYAVSSYLDGLAEIYFRREDYNRAKTIAHKSLALAQVHGLKEQIRDASLRLSSIYDAIRIYKSAFKYHKQYVYYRDSINNDEVVRKIANLHTKYKVAQKQKEVDEEKSQKELFFVVIICLGVILALLVGLIFIMLKNSKERKKVTKILQQQHLELEKANANKNKFFSILSHDLRSPLASYCSYFDVINLCVEQREYDRLKAISAELQSSSGNLLNLLDNLLQWGVNQMGNAESIPSMVNVKDLVLVEVGHLQNISNKKQIEVSIDIPKDVFLFVDRVSMAMAIRNLINNGLKFTPLGGRIAVFVQKENSTTIIKICDTGIGMTNEQKQKLFDFSDINSTFGTQNEKGIGLGLQLVSEFINSHHAKIEVKSEVGKGTTFVLSFPNKQ